MLYMPYEDLEAKRAYQRDWYRKNQQKCIEQAREARKKRNDDPVKRDKDREKRKLYKRRKRLEQGCELRENLTLWTAIKKAGSPSPIDLVKTQIQEAKAKARIQLLKTPLGRKLIKSQRNQLTKRLYATSLQNRLMHKEKRQRNKFQDSGNFVEKITQKQLLNRCALFGNCCAYCGSFEGLNIQLEHVIPRSKGGAHCLANIIPACHSCNQSKRAKDMIKWYKQQPFFSFEKLKKIQEVLNTTPYPVVQQELFHSWQIQHFM